MAEITTIEELTRGGQSRESESVAPTPNSNNDDIAQAIKGGSATGSASLVEVISKIADTLERGAKGFAGGYTSKMTPSDYAKPTEPDYDDATITSKVFGRNPAADSDVTMLGNATLAKEFVEFGSAILDKGNDSATAIKDTVNSFREFFAGFTQDVISRKRDLDAYYLKTDLLYPNKTAPTERKENLDESKASTVSRESTRLVEPTNTTEAPVATTTESPIVSSMVDMLGWNDKPIDVKPLEVSMAKSIGGSYGEGVGLAAKGGYEAMTTMMATVPALLKVAGPIATTVIQSTATMAKMFDVLEPAKATLQELTAVVPAAIVTGTLELSGALVRGFGSIVDRLNGYNSIASQQETANKGYVAAGDAVRATLNKNVDAAKKYADVSETLKGRPRSSNVPIASNMDNYWNGSDTMPKLNADSSYIIEGSFISDPGYQAAMSAMQRNNGSTREPVYVQPQPTPNYAPTAAGGGVQYITGISQTSNVSVDRPLH